MNNKSSCGYDFSFHVERYHALERSRFTFTAIGKRRTQVELMNNKSSCGYDFSFHVERYHALERSRFTFTAIGKRQTQVENFSE